MVIEIKNLVKKYKDVEAVKGINLEIEQGEIFGLLGPNGAGKSTTLSAMIGLIKIDGGSIKILGKDFTRNARDIKRVLGYVPQDLAFFEELSAIDNVKYWGKLYGLKGTHLNNAVKEALEFTGLWERRKSRSKTFSGGMKRRLNIACAIVHKPRILLMDEPTVGVDPQSRNKILESIRKLNADGTTVIYTSHYMEEIEAICNRVAIMDFGKVIAQGTVEELIDSVSAEKCMSIEFSEVTDQIIKTVEKTEGITECSRDENSLHVHMKKDDIYLTKLLENLVNNKIQIKALSLERPTLEMVFLQLTGKRLRD